MQTLFAYTSWTREWPGWARYGSAILVVLLMLVLRLGLADYLPAYPFLLFFIPIIVNAALFDQGSGAYSVLLCAALAIYFFIEPIGSFAIADPRQITSVVLFVLIGLTAAGIIEALHATAQELVRANKQFAAADQEKDLLLREAGHRMKNDLATLTALVRLQERAMQDQAARSALAATADRIQVLSRVRERLRLGQGANAIVDVAEFIAELCDDLKAAFLHLRPIVIKVDAEPHWLPQERSVAIGLIINELVTNSLKHAFPDDRSGAITVRFSRQDDVFELEVRDDGIGTPDGEGADRSPPTGLGQRLIRSMAAQLGGTVTVGPNKGASGTHTTVLFPAAP
ncbi:sensor histidine kinase [Microvirga sp. M2]|uniref:sensor histidine kinase n=1 Tax=Microvirga sp. M2 TaxID=3073270 RepID=UPI0039C4CA5F